MIKRLVVILLVLVMLGGAYGVGFKNGSSVRQIADQSVPVFDGLSIKQYSSEQNKQTKKSRLIGYWRCEYSVEVVGGAVVITDEKGEQTILTGKVVIREYKKGD